MNADENNSATENTEFTEKDTARKTGFDIQLSVLSVLSVARAFEFVLILS
jgi:hypothetical protein